MKKTITISLLLLFTLIPTGYGLAQLSFEGTEDFGRIYDLTYDPNIENKLYALTQGNHIIVSNDNGQNWEILYSMPINGGYLKDLKYFNDHTLGFNASNINTVFFYDLNTHSINRTLEPPITLGSTSTWIQSYDVYNDDTDIALLHQGYKIGVSVFAKVYYTVDSGVTWQEVYYNENHDSVFPNNVAIHPNNSNKLLILRGNGPTAVDGGLFISNDAGQTWEEFLEGNTLKPIAFHPQESNTIYIGTSIGDHDENLYRSTDNGATWEIVPINWSDFVLNDINKIVFNPTNTNNILVLEENQVLISNDEGQTWNNIIYPDDNPDSYYYGLNATFNPFNADEVFISANFYPFHSMDGGQTLTQHFNPYYPVTFVGTFRGDDDHVYYSVQNGIVHENISTASTSIFNIVPLNNFSNGARNYFVDEQTNGRIYSFGNSFFGASLKLSNDHGQTETDIYNTWSDIVLDIETVPSNPDKIWLSLLNEGVTIIDFSDLNNIVTTPISLPETNIVTRIIVDDIDPNVITIALRSKLYKSFDNGVSWEQIDENLALDIFNDYIFDIAIHPDNNMELILAASNGIHKSTDGGINWQVVYQGNNIRSIAYSPTNPDYLVASIYNSNTTMAELIYSEDSGDNWIQIPIEEIAYTGSNSMDYIFNDTSIDVYIASYDLGLMKYNIDLSSLSLPEYISNMNHVVIYPNPSDNLIHFKITNQENSIINITLLDLNGQEIMRTDDEQKLDISNISDGVYLAKIETSSGQITIKKIIKN